MKINRAAHSSEKMTYGGCGFTVGGGGERMVGGVFVLGGVGEVHLG